MRWRIEIRATKAMLTGMIGHPRPQQDLRLLRSRMESIGLRHELVRDDGEPDAERDHDETGQDAQRIAQQVHHLLRQHGDGDVDALGGRERHGQKDRAHVEQRHQLLGEAEGGAVDVAHHGRQNDEEGQQKQGSSRHIQHRPGDDSEQALDDAHVGSCPVRKKRRAKSVRMITHAGQRHPEAAPPNRCYLMVALMAS